MFFSKIRARLHRSKKKIISLERLASIWTGDKPVYEKKSAGFSAPQWAREDINRFYSRYVDSCKGISDHARRVIWRILSLLDENGDVSSCGDDEENSFAEITLLEHTLNVARISIDMIQKAHRDYKMIAGRILIAALGHLLGILSGADTLGGVSAKSILLLEPMIADLPFKQDVITAIGTYQDNRPKTEEAMILKAASARARGSEIERARMLSETWSRSYLDINKIKAIIKEE